MFSQEYSLLDEKTIFADRVKTSDQQCDKLTWHHVSCAASFGYWRTSVRTKRSVRNRKMPEDGKSMKRDGYADVWRMGSIDQGWETEQWQSLPC
jgi:hypothetical protein